MDIFLDTIVAELPGTDCGDCGDRSCRTFAFRFATEREVDAQACPHLKPTARQTLAGLKVVFRRRSRVALIVEENRCTACNECVVICPVNATLRQLQNEESMPLVLENDVVKVRRHCGALHNCVRCVEICPVEAIKLV
jgi:Na+-translocating ferredoxin:NAD+ oxidoreductase RNF subunit RnfB